VAVLKELNNEEVGDVYLLENSTGLVRGNTNKYGKPVISVSVGLCDHRESISVNPYSLYHEIESDTDPTIHRWRSHV
jgi:hypothetical protein